MPLRVVELFAGVGGFRLGLEGPPIRGQKHNATGRGKKFQTVWSNQWEPNERAQWASKCYMEQFGPDGHCNEDISTVDATKIPDHDLIVGGFPCQDYSVATTKAAGIQGKKGVLWWQIDRIIRAKRPSYVLLENVDRLLRSPADQRGRDFAIVLRCLADAGYNVEWRALNAADYGFPQKRRRVFIFAARTDTEWGQFMAGHASTPGHLQTTGFFARQFAVEPQEHVPLDASPHITLPGDIQMLSDKFAFHFLQAGTCVDGKVWTVKPRPILEQPSTLGSVLDQEVDESYFISPSHLKRWRYLKGSKAEERQAANGHMYHYTEGAIPFPDAVDKPARTILTGEGGKSPSRSNHLILDPVAQRYRRLTPTEVEKLNGFPTNWTASIPERRRYFTMGNALVVGLVARMGETLAASVKNPARGYRAALKEQIAMAAVSRK